MTSVITSKDNRHILTVVFGNPEFTLTVADTKKKQAVTIRLNRSNREQIRALMQY